MNYPQLANSVRKMIRMADITSSQIAEFIVDISYKDISNSTLIHTKNTLIDTIACAIGGFDSKPGQIARKMASTIQSADMPARILGNSTYSSPELAGFTNTTMIRYLDCNDSYFSPGGGHPSDMIGAALTLTEALGLSGQDLITSIVMGYEIFATLSDEIVVNQLGWDQGVFLGISAAAITAKLLGLPKNQITNALSLAIVPNLPMGATRVGELSMWKGCATAAAVKSGIFAALIAKEGLTSPEKPFDGNKGLWEQLGCDRPPTLATLEPRRETHKICDNIFKYYPSQIHTQAPIGLACQLSEKIDHTEIASIHIQSYRQGGVSTPETEPEKWAPTTRETADHSIPFLVSAALIDGTVNPNTFEKTNLDRQDIANLISITNITENTEYSDLYPAQYNCKIELNTTFGKHLEAHTKFPKGHQNNPFDSLDLANKFENLTSVNLSSEQRSNAMNILSNIEKVPTLSQLFDSLCITTA